MDPLGSHSDAEDYEPEVPTSISDLWCFKLHLKDDMNPKRV